MQEKGTELLWWGRAMVTIFADTYIYEKCMYVCHNSMEALDT